MIATRTRPPLTASKSLSVPSSPGPMLRHPPEPQLAFLFSDVGTGRLSGLMELRELDPAFKESIDQSLGWLRDETGPKMSWPEMLAASGSTPPLAAFALVAFENAVTQMWLSRGVKPSAVVGQGVGEIAAAICAGTINRDDGFRLALQDKADNIAGAIAARGGGLRRVPSVPVVALAAQRKPDGQPHHAPGPDQVDGGDGGGPSAARQTSRVLVEMGIDALLEVGPDLSIGRALTERGSFNSCSVLATALPAACVSFTSGLAVRALAELGLSDPLFDVARGQQWSITA